jgi:hypothetical protein
VAERLSTQGVHFDRALRQSVKVTPSPTSTPALTSRLGNISTRGFVQTDNNVMIGGFIVQGTQLKEVIVRAIGPELTPFGFPMYWPIRHWICTMARER